MKLLSTQDLNAFREKAHKALQVQNQRILICGETSCIARGALLVHETLKKIALSKDIPISVELDVEKHESSTAIKQCGCMGFCNKGPLIKFMPSGIMYIKVKPEDCQEIIEKTVLKGEIIERLLYVEQEKAYPLQKDIPFYKGQNRLILGECGESSCDDIADYIAKGGYSSLEKALFKMNDEEICNEIIQSNLLGRSGGSFPTGTKWNAVRKQTESTKYIVCNADEGDPSAFMDRSIMEGIPHKMIEGMIIAGIASGAKEGYVYLRAEYPHAHKRLGDAIDGARELGILGSNILGSGLDFDIKISSGAGAFICGEGSALIASIEGGRGMPRTRPPRTVEKGLFGKPTVLNNVETFATVPYIIEHGAEHFSKIGDPKSPGTKLLSLSGNIENAGLVEVEIGSTLRDIIFAIGGGMCENKIFKAVQIGGPCDGFLSADFLEKQLTFQDVKKGGIVVLDQDFCMVDAARFLMTYSKNESCGKCTPCREGSKRMVEILDRIVEGDGTNEDMDMMLQISETMRAVSLCGLGKAATIPVITTMQYFKEEYMAHIDSKVCPNQVCTMSKEVV
ncbi:MAG: NADH-ubiquinone oxidoreductase-F iron-sulfur binding region domain-containing protein [Oscillospiraceae bacterium]